MAALLNALDKQLGTNGHAEYSWAKDGAKDGAKDEANKLSDLKEKIVQLNFQLVRGANVSIKFRDILQILSCNIKNVETVSEEAKYYLTIVCKLIEQH